MNKKIEHKFKGTVIRNVYNSDDFKVYALEIDKEKYPYIKHNKFGNISISGELPDLTVGVEYEVVGTEVDSKNGVSYKVINIKRDIPTSQDDMYLFLQEILTYNQATELFKHYPDIVQRVKENRLDDIDLNKLHGIKEKMFSKIVTKIEENFVLADLVIEFQGYLSLSVIKKIYNRYTSIEVLKKRLRQDPYKCLCSLGGIGFKTADSILLDIEKVSKKNIKNGKEPIIDFEYDLRSSSQRCLACILYLLEENENNGHTRMSLVDLRKECIDTVPKCANHFTDVLKSDKIYYNKNTLDVSLKRSYDKEKYIADTILNSLKNNVKWDFKTELYRNVNGSNLSDEQMQVSKNVCEYTVSILNGAAGTGKSFSTQSVINMLTDNKKSFKLLAPTGKAAKVLKDFTNKPASTIHRGLSYMPDGFYYKDGKKVIRDNNEFYYEETMKKVEGKPFDFFTHFTFNKYNKLNVDMVICDEFSMVDIALFESLISAIDFNTTKLLLIGDNAQLPSVGCGNLLHDFMETKLIPTTTLTKVFRYDEGGLMKVATDVRFCKVYLSESKKNQMVSFGDNQDYRFVNLPSENIPDSVTGLYKKLLDNGNSIEDIQVLTAKNVGDCGTVALNNAIQKVANENYGSNIFMKSGETVYYEGDLVIQKVNNYKAEIDKACLEEWERETYEETGDKPTAFIANGESGIIKRIEKTYMLIDFDGIVVKYTKPDLTMIGLGYSITIHKSQGSSIKIPILCTPQSHNWMLNSNILYTGLTRMKEQCYHLGTLSTVNQAIKKKANIQRNTFMKELLLNKEGGNNGN